MNHPMDIHQISIIVFLKYINIFMLTVSSEGGKEGKKDLLDGKPSRLVRRANLALDRALPNVRVDPC